MVALLPLVPRADSGWALVIPLMVAGAGFGLLVSQLNNYTLSPITDERVSEAAGVNSAAGSFGLSFGLAFGGAIMLATLSIAFTQMSDASTVLPPAAKTQVATALEDDAQVMSDSQLQAQIADQPPAIQQEIIAINTDARPLALQVALGVPIIAGLFGLLLGFRMMRRPDPVAITSPAKWRSSSATDAQRPGACPAASTLRRERIAPDDAYSLAAGSPSAARRRSSSSALSDVWMTSPP